MTARILPATTTALQEAASILRAGEIVGMPTETVYGLAGNALDEAALTRIFSTKERPTFDPLIVHVSPQLLAGASTREGRDGDGDDVGGDAIAALEAIGLVDTLKLSDNTRTHADMLITAFWPGPLTLVLPKLPMVPDLVTSGLPNVAVRMPAHPVAQSLIDAAGTPLAAPSANRFGRISPTSARDVYDELGDRIPLILDGGPCTIGVESTVVGFLEEGTPVLLRPGGIPVEAIEEELECRVVRRSELAQDPSPSGETTAQVSPGLLDSHYAPRKKLTLVLPSNGMWESLRARTNGPVGVLTLGPTEAPSDARLGRLPGGAPALLALSETGSAEEAARNLFLRLRELDRSSAEELFAEAPADARGLWHAVLDRLTRAAAPRI
jgi:L-threonylcarbamoyladenylate synthase